MEQSICVEESIMDDKEKEPEQKDVTVEVPVLSLTGGQ